MTMPSGNTSSGRYPLKLIRTRHYRILSLIESVGNDLTVSFYSARFPFKLKFCVSETRINFLSANYSGQCYWARRGLTNPGNSVDERDASGTCPIAGY